MPLKAASAPMGSSRGCDAGAEALAELVQGPLEVGPLAVELVDEHEPGMPSSVASRQVSSDWTSTPSTALTTSTARSATDRPASTSAMKSA